MPRSARSVALAGFAAANYKGTVLAYALEILSHRDNIKVG